MQSKGFRSCAENMRQRGKDVPKITKCNCIVVTISSEKKRTTREKRLYVTNTWISTNSESCGAQGAALPNTTKGSESEFEDRAKLEEVMVVFIQLRNCLNNIIRDFRSFKGFENETPR